MTVSSQTTYAPSVSFASSPPGKKKKEKKRGEEMTGWKPGEAPNGEFLDCLLIIRPLPSKKKKGKGEGRVPEIGAEQQSFIRRTGTSLFNVSTNRGEKGGERKKKKKERGKGGRDVTFVFGR